MKPSHFPLYDIVVVGDGLSGWLLLEALSHYPTFSSQRVLIISEGKTSERSWCFWDENLDAPLSGMVHSSWSQMAFHAGNFSKSSTLRNQRYNYIPGRNFFAYFREEFIHDHQNITLLIDKVDSIEGSSGNFVVVGNDSTYRSKQVYNSAFLGQKPKVDLWQHFRGWFIETAIPQFNTDEALLMDFNVPQNHGCSFMYLLPLSQTRALVELTFFSPHVLDAEEYDNLLAKYIQENFGSDYNIIDREQGQIPMQQGVFRLTGDKGEYNIGTLAGMVKPSTGYAFQRIRQDSKDLAAAYFMNTAPKRSSESNRFAFYDALLLWILRNHPEAGKPIFTRLFKRCKTERILRFMDQRTSIWEEIGIFARLPIAIFLKALFYHVLPVKAGKQPSTQNIQVIAKRA